MLATAAWLRSLLLIALCLLAARAQAHHVWVLANTQESHHSAFADNLRRQLDASKWRHSLTVHASLAEALASGAAPPAWIVTLGVDAAKSAAKWPGNVLHALVTAAEYRAIYGERSPSTRTAVLLGQPLSRYVALVKAALPSADRIVLPVTDPQTASIDELRESAARAGLTLLPEVIHSPEALDSLLERAVPGRDALLLLPDVAVLSRASVKVAVVGSYKYRLPLIVYSEALVKAGALAAVHSTIDQMADEVAAIIRRNRPGQPLPAPSPGSGFSVSANYQLARALQIALPSEAALWEAVKAASR